MDLCGLSTHQSFCDTRTKDARQKDVDHTIRCIELGYSLAIPNNPRSTRVVGHVGQFSMKFDGEQSIEPDPRQGTPTGKVFALWVRDSFEKCIPVAEKCGVVMDWKTTGDSGSLTPQRRVAG